MFKQKMILKIKNGDYNVFKYPTRQSKEKIHNDIMVTLFKKCTYCTW